MDANLLIILLATVLVAVGIALIVGAARHRTASGGARGKTIGFGAMLFVIGLLMLLGPAPSEFPGWVPAAVIGAATLGAVVGYISGQASGKPSH